MSAGSSGLHSAFAFFEHERAASAFNASPLAVIEWLHVQSLQLHTSPIGAAAFAIFTPRRQM